MWVTALQALVGGALVLFGVSRLGRGRAVWAGALAAGVGFGAWLALAPPPVAPVPDLPGASPQAAFVTSAACRACHPAEYASWRATFHRTMTQPATPATVLGDFDGVELQDRGAHMRLERRPADGSFWAHLLTPGGGIDRSRRVVMTTGAHHFQNYWLAEDDGWYVQLPFLWRVDSGRWLPVQDSFLHPDQPTPQGPGLWNGNCSYCHSVGSAAGLDRGTANTRAAELGISCEACHGPGEAHVARYRSPLARYLGGDDPADPVVAPSRLDHRREVAVCGQCHGIFMRTNLAQMNTQADHFRPGDPLGDTRQLFLPAPNPTGQGDLLIPPAEGPVTATLAGGGRTAEVTVLGFDRQGVYLRPAGPAPQGGVELVLSGVGEPPGPPLRLRGLLATLPGGLLRLPVNSGWGQDAGEQVARRLGWRGQVPVWFDMSAFWPDGTVRSTGRETNALARTGCYTRGEMGCGSCHSMHAGEAPDDMLAPGMRGDQACLQCHQADVPDVAAHSHHPADSDGARCQNCHMPHTTFGLLGAIRSHRVDSPDATRSWRTGRPDACALCHTDRPLGWVGAHLTQWYGQPPLRPLPPPWDTTAAAALWALTGDGAQRGVAAWALGWGPAQAASGRTWTAPILAALLDDDYAAVRSVAGRALAPLLPAGWAYDFVAPPADRQAAAAAARAALPAADRAGPAVLHDAAGRPLTAAVERLRAARDRRPVHIAE